jgi:hypothetical protein
VDVLPASNPVRFIKAPEFSHVVADCEAPVSVGVGLIVTSTVKEEPTHPLGAVGVTVYLTTAAVLPLLVRAWAIELPHELLQLLYPEALPDCTAAVQVKVVPTIVEFSVTLLVPPLHSDCGDAEPTGVGLTLNVTSWVNDEVQFGDALVMVTPVISSVCPLLAAIRAAEEKLAAPVPSATTPVTAVCATPLMV